mmetsp:Transcript_78932/g.142383  ORF Transcript_78932/g.142383 Transcript_78932/m.142383 type:complete len:94 (-) Transcript_78932:811-1092(-)
MPPLEASPSACGPVPSPRAAGSVGGAELLLRDIAPDRTFAEANALSQREAAAISSQRSPRPVRRNISGSPVGEVQIKDDGRCRSEPTLRLAAL